MSKLRIVLVVLAFMPAIWMTFDGTRALVLGDYVTPKDGPYAGQLGPWARLVSRVGIAPRATGMKITFIVLGLSWLLSAVSYAARKPGSDRMLAVTAVATLWYLPVGTAVALVELGGLYALHARADVRSR